MVIVAVAIGCRPSSGSSYLHRFPLAQPARRVCGLPSYGPTISDPTTRGQPVRPSKAINR